MITIPIVALPEGGAKGGGVNGAIGVNGAPSGGHGGHILGGGGTDRGIDDTGGCTCEILGGDGFGGVGGENSGADGVGVDSSTLVQSIPKAAPHVQTPLLQNVVFAQALGHEFVHKSILGQVKLEIGPPSGNSFTPSISPMEHCTHTRSPPTFATDTSKLPSLHRIG